MRMTTGRSSYGLGLVVAGATALVLVCLSLGVGIIGRDGDPASFMYFGVLAVGLIGGARTGRERRYLTALASAPATKAAAGAARTPAPRAG